MLKLSPKPCVEHAKSNSSRYPDPDMFLHSSDLSPLCPPLPIIFISNTMSTNELDLWTRFFLTADHNSLLNCSGNF